MPTPKTGETRDDFVKRCIPIVIEEGTAKDGSQANAVCISMWEQAQKMKVDTVEIKNVEVLKTGKWNGIDVKGKDLDQMVKNFKDGILEPFLNLDHDDKFTDKVKRALSVVSLGFVSQLRRLGDSLVADFKQVPKKVAELISSGMLKKRSVEFFRTFPLNGKVFDNVLKAVSFFGADVPAVNALSDDFDILLKTKENAITLKDVERDPIKINFKEVQVDTIELKKSEYDDLLKNQNTISRLQSDLENKESLVVKLTEEKEETEKELKKAKEELNGAKEKLGQVEKEKEENLKAEAEGFVSELIKDGKLLPKFKQDKVDDYIAKASEPEKLKSFKEDLESRDKIINFTELPGGEEGGGVRDINDLSPDEINERVEAKMKKDGVDFDEACKKLGVKL